VCLCVSVNFYLVKSVSVCVSVNVYVLRCLDCAFLAGPVLLPRLCPLSSCGRVCMCVGLGVCVSEGTFHEQGRTGAKLMKKTEIKCNLLCCVFECCGSVNEGLGKDDCDVLSVESVSE
jgi:hypothetical protein